MHLGDLTNTESYEKLHPLFAEAFEYLKKIDFKKEPVGTTKLKGDDLFVIVSDSNLKDSEDAKLEAHNTYIDIQLPISKHERFGWKDRAKVTMPIGEFDEAKDIQFFDDKAPVYFDIAPGNFIIFFPNDVHAPCIGEGVIRKVIVKVKL